MKIDFNKNGMAIKFDKVPRFIYINEEGFGVGQVYFDGVRKKGLQKVKIEAKTADMHSRPPLKYHIQYVEKDISGEPLFMSNMKEGLSVSVKITDLDIFENFLNWAKTIIEDSRIPEEVRSEYYNSLMKAVSKEEEK